MAKPHHLLDTLTPGEHAVEDACALGDLAATVGFDWPDAQGALEKVQEETQELAHWLDKDTAQARAEQLDEFGDLFFAVCMVARKLNIEPMFALAQANEKFKRRFGAVEEALWQMGTTTDEATLDEMEAAWQSIKHQTR